MELTGDDVAKGMRVRDLDDDRIGTITSFNPAAPEFVKVRFDGERRGEEIHVSGLERAAV